MKQVLISFLVFCGLSLAGCDQVRIRTKPEEIQGTPAEKPHPSDSLYVMDGPGGLFKGLKWYDYEMATHLIWPLYDIYAIQTSTQIYLIQIQAYYSGDVNTAGDYRLAFKSPNSIPQLMSFGAGACGNPFTNPDFEACQKDPERNLFTAVSLDQNRSWKISEAGLRSEAEWDLAFRGTEIRLNSGTAGPGEVRGALAKRFDFFFDSGGKPLATSLRRIDLQDKAKQAFAVEPFRSSYAFSLPEGVDRVIYEKYWFREDSAGAREALSGNSWVLRSRDGLSFLNFRITAIDDQWGNGNFQTRLRMTSRLQKNSGDFGSDAKDRDIEFSTGTRLASFCFRIDGGSPGYLMDIPCGQNQWDLKLVTVNTLKDGVWTRDWRFFTGGGAQGPLRLKNRVELTDKGVH